MGILLGIGNIEKVSFDEDNKKLIVLYTDGHEEETDLSSLSTSYDDTIAELKKTDTTLETAITIETARAKAAESANTTLTNEETARAKTAESSLTTALNSKAEASALTEEQTRAEEAETTLNGLIESETARAKEAESALSESISANATAISAEETRAKAAEAGFVSEVVTETNRATAEEERLASLIDDEVTRAKAAEDEIRQSGGDTSTCVHLTGDETITGAKTFDYKSILYVNNKMYFGGTSHGFVNKWSSIDVLGYLSSDSQDSLNIADCLNYFVTDYNVYRYAEAKANKVTSLSGASTDVQYPTAKCMRGLLSTTYLELGTTQEDITADGKKYIVTAVEGNLGLNINYKYEGDSVEVAFIGDTADLDVNLNVITPSGGSLIKTVSTNLLKGYTYRLTLGCWGSGSLDNIKLYKEKLGTIEDA